MAFVFGNHERMKDVERRAGFIARSGLPVWIEGASGSGKEALEEYLHELSGTETPLLGVICRQTGPIVYPGALPGTRNVDLGEICSNPGSTVFLKNVHRLSHAGARILSSATESIQMVRRAANGNRVPAGAPSRLLDVLREYDWPGNLRELQNIAGPM